MREWGTVRMKKNKTEMLGYWLPILLKKDKSAVRRILEWELKRSMSFFITHEPPHWIEHGPEDIGGYPATLGWKVVGIRKK